MNYNFLVDVSIRVTHSDKFSSLALFYDETDERCSSVEENIIMNLKVSMNLQEMAVTVLNIPDIKYSYIRLVSLESYTYAYLVRNARQLPSSHIIGKTEITTRVAE